MIDYSIEDILKDGQNYYALIIAVSKMARSIVDEENEERGICPDNPIELAVKRLKTGKYDIVMP